MLKSEEFGLMKLSRQKEIINLTKNIETPFFLLDINVLRNKIEVFKKIFKKSEINFNILYSVKTNYNPFIIKFLHSRGIGLEIISGLEIDLLSKLDLLNNDVIVNGPSKSTNELKKVINANTIIQSDSLEEIQEINNICCSLNKSVRIGLRVQPLDSTWKRFGIPSEKLSFFVKEVKDKFNNVNIVGLHSHLGTQILDTKAYEDLANQLCRLSYENDLIENLEYLNLGGGLPSFSAPLTHHIKKPEPLSSYFKAIEIGLKDFLKLKKGIKIYMEPGRAIVDESMDLVCSVMSSDFGRIILDTGKNDIPSLNIRKHPIVFEKSDDKQIPQDIFGCLCMRSDSFPEKESAPSVKRGDRALISTLGAYVNSQSMTFIKYKPPIYYFDSALENIEFKLLERKQNINDILSRYV